MTTGEINTGNGDGGKMPGHDRAMRAFRAEMENPTTNAERALDRAVEEIAAAMRTPAPSQQAAAEPAQSVPQPVGHG